MSFGFTGETRALQTAFADGWAASVWSLVPVQYDNEPFTRPNIEDAWVAFTTLTETGDAADVGGYREIGGGPRVEWAGNVQLDFFFPKAQGRQPFMPMIDVSADILALRTFTVDAAVAHFIKTHGPELATLGEEPDGWFRFALTVPYRREIQT